MPAKRPARLHGLLVAIALILPFGASPAHADLDRRDVVRILGGLAAVYVLSEALERERERDAARVARPLPQPGTRTPAPIPAQPGETYSHIHADGSGGGGWHEHTVGENHATAPHPRRPVARPTDRPQVARQAPAPAPLPDPARPVDMRIIPAQCRTQTGNAVEVSDGYDAACMQNAVVLPGSLPPQCLRQVATTDGTRTLYDGACLRREGWSARVARN